MTVLSRFSRMLNATSLSAGHPRDPALARFFVSSGASASGVVVTPDTAVRSTAVLACVRLLSETIASLPLFMYDLLPDNKGRSKDSTSLLAHLLHDRPNKYQTTFEWIEMFVGHLLLRGNSYNELLSTNSNAIGGIVPLHPDRVTPFIYDDNKIAYMYRGDAGSRRIILSGEMMHIKGLPGDGLEGVSVIQHASETIGSAIAADEYSSRFLDNDAKPGGILEMDSKFKDDEERKRFRDSWQSAHSGENRHKTAVLENGIKYKELGTTNKDAQFLELRNFQVNDIARLFRVPPHMIADLSRATFSNVEQEAISFVVHTIRPWLVRIEQAFKRDLLVTAERRNKTIEFELNGLLRGDVKSRYDAYAVGRNNGLLSANDVRKLENQNPLPPDQGGDTYLVQGAMIAQGDVGGALKGTE